jgi:hypothetical protein
MIHLARPPFSLCLQLKCPVMTNYPILPFLRPAYVNPGLRSPRTLSSLRFLAVQYGNHSPHYPMLSHTPPPQLLYVTYLHPSNLLIPVHGTGTALTTAHPKFEMAG